MSDWPFIREVQEDCKVAQRSAENHFPIPPGRERAGNEVAILHPEGVGQESPGQRPGRVEEHEIPGPERARENDGLVSIKRGLTHEPVSPFQGEREPRDADREPGALPLAFLWHPFRVKNPGSDSRPVPQWTQLEPSKGRAGSRFFTARPAAAAFVYARGRRARRPLPSLP